MCLFGGLCKEGPQNDVYLVDTQSLIVTPVQVSGDIPMPRDGHTAVCSNHWVVVFGGESDDGKCEDSLYALNLETRRWLRVNVQGNIPLRRRDHTAVMANGVMFIFGGQSDGYFFNDLMAFDTRTLTAPTPRWEFYEPANDGPSGRAGHSTTVYQDRLYVFGGTDGETFFNEMWCYDLHTCEWELLNVTGHTPPGRAGHAAALVDDCIYVTGGKSASGKNLSDVVAFRIRTMRWYTFQRMGPAPTSRSGHSMCVFGSRVFVLSGEAREGEDPSAIHVLEAGK
ncbi:hypothetical protein BDF19DRAFT_385140 [Syncephalis fuscata]|nr:hypothetical protein BDF19DRAFT_385140 [Syncephalis fuscata]